MAPRPSDFASLDSFRSAKEAANHANCSRFLPVAAYGTVFA